jgi:hypothetical protein
MTPVRPAGSVPPASAAVPTSTSSVELPTAPVPSSAGLQRADAFQAPPMSRFSVDRRPIQNKEDLDGRVDKAKRQLEGALKQAFGRDCQVTVTPHQDPSQPWSISVVVPDFDPVKDAAGLRAVADPKLNVGDIFKIGGREGTPSDAISFVGKPGSDKPATFYRPPFTPSKVSGAPAAFLDASLKPFSLSPVQSVVTPVAPAPNRNPISAPLPPPQFITPRPSASPVMLPPLLDQEKSANVEAERLEQIRQEALRQQRLDLLPLDPPDSELEIDESVLNDAEDFSEEDWEMAEE